MKTKTKKQKIYTIVLEYQNPKLTLETIRSLKKAKVPKGFSHNIIVVDNSPIPDGTLQKKLPYFKNIELITTKENTGFAKGNNIGIKHALKQKADYFLLLNNDVEVHVDFLIELIKTAKKGADLVVPKIYFAKGYEFHKNQYKKSQLGKVLWYAGGYFDWDNVMGKHIGMDEVDKGQYDQEKEIEFANACCILIKKQVIKKIKMLDTKYFLYFEDADFSYRAHKAGFKQIYQPRSIIYHKVSASSGSASKLHDYYITRNRLIFGFKYANSKTKFALFRQSIKHLLSGSPGQKQGIMDFYLNRLGKGNLV